MNASLTPNRTPDGYPVDFERWIEVADGRSVFARPVVPDDSGELLRELERADTDTIYQRFFRAPVRLDAAQLDRLTRLDYASRLALAAFSPDGHGVAIVRYETTEPGIAEIAVVVRADWRGVGLGTALIALLETAAIARGIRRFIAYYLPDNIAIETLLAARGFTVGIRDSEVALAEKMLVMEPVEVD